MFKKLLFFQTTTSFIWITVVCFMSSTLAQNIKWSWNNTGEFYLYSLFKKGASAFIDGGDIDSYGNYIYVNRDAIHLDVYKISAADPAKASQHPDNPKAPGPVVERTLTHIKTYTIPKLSTPACGELYAVNDGVYFLGGTANANDVFYYDFNSGVTSVICDSKDNTLWIHLLGYDEVHDVWYGGLAHNALTTTRIVYSFNQTEKKWEKEFEYEDMQGNHFDGMEVIATQKETKIYISDMTSDYIGIVSNESGSWKTVSINKYEGGNAANVEGMGYGAFHHFWITSYESGQIHSLYEIGGGGLTVVEPEPETVTVSIPVEQSFSVEEHSPGGTFVGDITIASSNVSKAKIKIINVVSEFEVNSQSPFAITVANGANLDYNTKNTYQFLVVVYTETGIVSTPDTSIVTILILPKTGIAGGSNKGMAVASFTIKGDNLIIKGLTERAYNLSITNLKGQEMFKIKNGSKTMIDISTVPSGIYFVALTYRNRMIFNKIHITRL